MNGMELHDFFLVEFVVHGLFFLFVTAGVVRHGRGLLCHFHYFVVTWLAFNHTAATTEHGGLHLNMVMEVTYPCLGLGRFTKSLWLIY